MKRTYVAVSWLRCLVASILACTTLASASLAADVSGAGATFPYPVYSAWADAYKKETGQGVRYQGIGSSGGIAQVKAGTVAFGATDMPLSAEVLDRDGLIQFPLVIGGVTPVINLPGVASGQVTLDGPLLADIFLGRVEAWNDPRIVQLNPGLKLPSAKIVPVVRADGSGSTFLLTHYLAQESTAFRDTVGVSATPTWPNGVHGRGNEGMAEAVMQTSGGIGYVEFAYAREHKMTTPSLVNRAGRKLAPGVAGFRAAANGVDWSSATAFGTVLTDAQDSAAWPISGMSFILLRHPPADAGADKAARTFFVWALNKGAKIAEEQGYAALSSPAGTAVQGLLKRD